MNAVIVIAAATFFFGSFRPWALWVGLAIEWFYLGWRGVMLGRLPILGPHDTVLLFAASIALMAAVFGRSKAIKGTLFPWAAGLTAGFFSLFALLFPPMSMPMPAILRTFWFELHVILAFFAYGLFTVAALLAAIYFSKKDRGLIDLLYRAMLAGFTFFSLSMVTGGIWGHYAWGTYWLWTPKELWTSILWLYYGAALHIRLKGVAWERAMAWSGLIGLAVTLFTYLGVSMLMKSSHSF